MVSVDIPSMESLLLIILISKLSRVTVSIPLESFLTVTLHSAFTPDPSTAAAVIVAVPIPVAVINH